MYFEFTASDATLSLGIPIEDGLDRSLPLGDIVEFSDTVQHPLLRRPPTVGRLDGTGNVVVGQNGMNANAGTSLVNDNYRFGRNAAVFGGVMNNELPFQRIMVEFIGFLEFQNSVYRCAKGRGRNFEIRSFKRCETHQG